MTGCAGSDQERNETEESSEENINQDDAEAKIEEHLEEAAAVLPEGVELEPVGDMTTGACDDPSDGGPKGRVTVNHAYWLRGLSAEDHETAAESLHQYWSDNGYDVLEDSRPEEIYLWVEHPEDAFRMSLWSSVEGDLSIEATSPCFWPEGQP